MQREGGLGCLLVHTMARCEGARCEGASCEGASGCRPCDGLADGPGGVCPGQFPADSRRDRRGPAGRVGHGRPPDDDHYPRADRAAAGAVGGRCAATGGLDRRPDARRCRRAERLRRARREFRSDARARRWRAPERRPVRPPQWRHTGSARRGGAHRGSVRTRLVTLRRRRVRRYGQRDHAAHRGAAGARR